MNVVSRVTTKYITNTPKAIFCSGQPFLLKKTEYRYHTST